MITIEPTQTQALIAVNKSPSSQTKAVEKGTNHDFTIDALRAYAIILVVLVHSAAPYLHGVAAKTLWWPACLLHAAGRPCVPLFLMTSGMLLLAAAKNDQSESISNFLKKRASKVLMPLIAWSVVYICWIDYCNNFKLSGPEIFSFIGKPACYHLTYLYYLLGLYLATPILRVFTVNAKKSELYYFVALWLVAASAWPTFAFFHLPTPPIVFTVTTGFVGFFVLGHLLENVKMSPKHWVPVAAFFILYMTISAGGTYLISGKAVPGSSLDEFFFVYTNPIVILYSALTFVTIRSFKWNLPEPIKKSISSLAVASFTIYLVHPLLLEAVASNLGWIMKMNGHRSVLSFVFILAVTAVTVCLSYLFYRTCRLFKVSKWIVP